MYRSTSAPVVRTLGLTLAVVLAACGKKDNNAAVQTPDTMAAAAPAPAATPAAALHVTSADLGKSVGTDKHIANATNSFGVRDTVYLSVITDGAAPSAKVTARWTYGPKAQLVKEQTENIAPTGGTTATVFRLDKASAWPKGKYKVVVSLDGTAAQTKEFEVK